MRSVRLGCDGKELQLIRIIAVNEDGSKINREQWKQQHQRNEEVVERKKRKGGGGGGGGGAGAGGGGAGGGGGGHVSAKLSLMTVTQLANATHRDRGKY